MTFFSFLFPSLNPGYSKAIEGIQNVEKRNGSVDLDSDDDALDTNNAEVISLEEVGYHLGEGDWGNRWFTFFPDSLKRGKNNYGKERNNE